MGIFSSIKNAIFGDDEEDKKPVDRPDTKPTATSGPKERAAITLDEVENRIGNIPGADKLNWQTSIVDLMKLVKIDPSYENRKELATELGMVDYSGTAEQNIALHRAVMNKIALAGGVVPGDLKD
ncbi:hypothetical protein NAP1_01415 [Erythrobacter sp. NAP1]|uniref:DUF3597 domain-containing protein n=1 Tax=Erythrobacter sp. NAP1 TaxID=237727 RepID=UPI0000686ADC|nr:DUF3597 domain-containing protein [Erythrobacter sp. NAP1]EAQ29389.1 hypothetical protein NAP1_01415 [Erythrobacter sp. NAP1]